MQSALFERLVDAILARRLVLCAYHGFPRVCYPRSIGWTEGIERLLAYQFAGDSAEGLQADGEWRCFDVHGMESVTIFEGEWHPQPTPFTAARMRSDRLLDSLIS
jgi:hypothetical protein